MIKPINDRIILPLAQAVYAYRNDLVKGLAIYLYLKFYTNGKVNDKDLIFPQLLKDLSIKDARTFDKHMALLIAHKWIGHCAESGVYFIRSTRYIRQLHEFRGRQGAEVSIKDLGQIQVFLAAIIIGKEVNDQRFYWDVARKRGFKEAPDKWLGAKHPLASSSSSARPAYFGLCNKTIAALLGCKPTRACILKNKAVEMGYLNVSHRYLDIMKLEKPDYSVKQMLYEQFPKIAGRVKCWRKWDGKKKYIVLVQQLHDEIACNIAFKRIEKFNTIHLPREQASSIPTAAAHAA